jgi:hypothetical protein
MAFVSYAVTELADPLKIEDSVIAYAEVQFGWQRNKRYQQTLDRVRLGLQTSPENFFYDETAFAGARYVYLKALEFTALAGTAEALAYDTAPGTEMWSLVGGPVDPNGGGVGTPGIVAGTETCKSKLTINEALIEQIEIREGETYTVCDSVGDPVDTTTRQIHLSLKSSNKPDFTFYEFAPQPKYRFNRDCNLCTDGLDPTLSVAYMGANNYVLSKAQFAATLAVVQGLS